MITSKKHLTRVLASAALIGVALTSSTACDNGISQNVAAEKTTEQRAGKAETRLRKKRPAAEPAPTMIPRGSETGEPAELGAVAPEYAKPKKRPLAVIVENHPDARPQTGLDRADVVYEAPAEYGISRFMAIFVNQDAPILGPIRSARPYYVAWASEYDPVFIHAGGSPKAMRWIKQLDVTDVDAIYDSIGGFERTSDRIAPHNLYADTREVRRAIAATRDLQGDGTWGGLRFGSQFTVGPKEGREVSVAYDAGYDVRYTYDERAGLYLREMEGKPHLDRESKEQLNASVVIVQTVGMWQVEGDKYGRLEAAVQAKNRALILQDGRLIEGYWEKDKRDSPTLYTTQDGQPITLKPGRVWIQIAPAKGTKVEHR